MRSFHCSCGNTIYFENTQCVACGLDVGWCPLCASMSGLIVDPGGVLRCGNASCGAALVKCRNWAIEDVCNRAIALPAGGRAADALCDYCRFNHTIPDLSIPGNRGKWYRLERAKRRLLYTLDLLRLPYGAAADGFTPSLCFSFKADTAPSGAHWSVLGLDERVLTGHFDGKITINIREADPVERERARVRFGEVRRTLIGHFRHEIAHYYWELLVRNRREDDCRRVFDDHDLVRYTDALARYYRDGPPADWQRTFISSYASAHPWEDFAETFATWLDLVSVLDTAKNLGLTISPTRPTNEFDDLLARYQRLGVVLNEMNRAMGNVDLVPEIFVPRAIEKLRFVHDLVRSAARPAGSRRPV